MKIKLQKGRVNHIWKGLGFDVFKNQTIETKIIEIPSAKYMKENELPTAPKTISNWKTRKETVKIRGTD